MKSVLDKYGNELQCGDFVCFTSTSGNWRQTPDLLRVRVADFFTDNKGDWIIPENDITCPIIKILASRVIKCY